MIPPGPKDPGWLTEYASKVDASLAKVLGDGTSSIERAAAEALAGGKRVRAVLALLWCEAISGNPDSAIPVATAYELAHAAALVQDDILDESKMRRGSLSIVEKYGLRAAILASNLLLALVPRQIVEYGEGGQGGETLKKLFDLLGESFGSAVLGEYLDLEMAANPVANEEEYMSMIRLKTGALIGASSASGALVGDPRSDELVRKAYEFGETLGMAYQVRDDLLDVMGDEKLLGKPAFTDLRGGKKNLLLIHSLERCTPAESRVLGSFVASQGEASASKVSAARAIFERTGSVEYAKGVAASLTSEARAVLRSVDLGEAGRLLADLSEQLVNRKY